MSSGSTKDVKLAKKLLLQKRFPAFDTHVSSPSFVRLFLPWSNAAWYRTGTDGPLNIVVCAKTARPAMVGFFSFYYKLLKMFLYICC